jgi:putative NADPH-quinone reductase
MSFKKDETKTEPLEILVILAHPDKSSFNHAIAETAVAQIRMNGHRVIFHDLYAEGFDPILAGPEIVSDAPLPDEIQRHCNHLKMADGIIIVHPNWWGEPPAILKGWIDRVIRPNVAYKFLEGDNGEGVPEGLLKARSAIVFNTANTPEAREREMFGDPLELIWKNCIFDLCGVHDFHREMFRIIITSSEAMRKKWLRRVEEMVSDVISRLQS